MKSILKNIIMIAAAFILLYSTLNIEYYKSYINLFFILMIIAYVYQDKSIKNKEYKFATLFKIIYTACLFANGTYIVIFKQGWDVLGAVAALIIIIIAAILNIIIRVLFRIIHKQKFNFKANMVQNIVLIILTILTIIVPIIIVNI